MPKPRAPVVIALIALNVVMFAIEIATGADPLAPAPQKLIALGADFGPLTLHGEPWRLVASMFLHFGVIHIGMNMICLWQGRFVENLFGPIGFIAIYLVAGLLGGIASLVHSTMVVSVGASGAVFGVFGAFGAFLLMRRDRLDPAAVIASAKSLVSWIGLNLVLGFSIKAIDVSAHMGGLIAGFLVGVALLAGASAERQRMARSIAVIVAGVALSLGALHLIPTSPVEQIRRLNDEMFTQRQHLNAQLDAHDITQAQYAEILDRDIVPAWHDARVDLDDMKVSADNTIYVEKLRAYAWLEEDELQTLSEILHANKLGDPDASQALTEKQQAATAARREVQDEAQGVTPK